MRYVAVPSYQTSASPTQRRPSSTKLAVRSLVEEEVHLARDPEPVLTVDRDRLQPSCPSQHLLVELVVGRPSNRIRIRPTPRSRGLWQACGPPPRHRRPGRTWRRRSRPCRAGRRGSRSGGGPGCPCAASTSSSSTWRPRLRRIPAIGGSGRGRRRAAAVSAGRRRRSRRDRRRRRFAEHDAQTRQAETDGAGDDREGEQGRDRPAGANVGADDSAEAPPSRRAAVLARRSRTRTRSRDVRPGGGAGRRERRRGRPVDGRRTASGAPPRGRRRRGARSGSVGHRSSSVPTGTNASRRRPSARDVRDLTVPRGMPERLGGLRLGQVEQEPRAEDLAVVVAQRAERGQQLACAARRPSRPAPGPGRPLGPASATSAARSARPRRRPADRRRLRASLATMRSSHGRSGDALAKAGEGVERFEEGFLHRIVGIGLRADEVRGPDGDVLIAAHDGLVRRDVAAPGARDQFGVFDVDGPPRQPYSVHREPRPGSPDGGRDPLRSAA